MPSLTSAAGWPSLLCTAARRSCTCRLPPTGPSCGSTRRITSLAPPEGTPWGGPRTPQKAQCKAAWPGSAEPAVRPCAAAPERPATQPCRLASKAVCSLANLLAPPALLLCSRRPNDLFQRVMQLFRQRCGARLHWGKVGTSAHGWLPARASLRCMIQPCMARSVWVKAVLDQGTHPCTGVRACTRECTAGCCTQVLAALPRPPTRAARRPAGHSTLVASRARRSTPTPGAPLAAQCRRV